ncbi:LysR substrate-binding domain-containing protein [Caballeronia sordidicola]|uniref:LysR substrate-binding domain-containing protein n=1 Tax=Caballeronia sordidicola TaxID=196367 RepID=UPI002E11A3EE
MARPFELLGMEWLVEFYARYPHISLEFLLDDTPTDLISERIDLALRMGIETGSGFKVRRLAPSAMILAVSPAYLERRAAPRTLHELAEPCNSIVRMSSRGSIVMRRRSLRQGRLTGRRAKNMSSWGLAVDGLVPRRRWLVSRVRELTNALVASSVDARWPYTPASNASIDHTRRYINRRKRPPSEAA